jgi:PAS domain S-box-containing protein
LYTAAQARGLVEPLPFCLRQLPYYRYTIHMPRPLLPITDIAKIHLKSQALVNIFFGIPMVTLVLPFWGLPLIATIKVTVTYLCIYVIYFIPLWFLVPKLLLRPIRPILRRLDAGEEVDDLTLKKLIEFLLNYPLYSAIREFGLIISGFVIGALLIPLGVVSELLPIVGLAMVYVSVVGIVVSVIESFLNFTFLENRLAKTISAVLTLKPYLAGEQFESRRVSLLSKMIFVVLGTVMAAQLIIFIFMVGKLAINFPQLVSSTVLYLGAFMLLTAGYVVLAASIFTRNISTPLKQLIAWSEGVMKGERGNLPLLTNDELSDVVSYSNHMVSNLDALTHWLQQERDQLKLEKDKLAIVLSRVADGVVATDQHGQIILFNSAMEDLTQWSEKDALDQPMSSIVPLYRDTGRIYPLHDMFVATQDVHHQLHTRHAELRLVSKQQRDRYVKLSATTLGEESSSQLGWIFTFHDVTEERELERMKLDFVSMAAHELRTPLTAIRGYLSLLSEEMGTKLNKDELLFLNRSLIGSNQLSALIENLLNVSRIERGALTLEPAAISIDHLICGVLDSLSEIALQKDIAIAYTSAKTEAHLVLADHFRLAEVLTNLLANALNYSPSHTRVTIEVTAKLRDRQMVVSVIDQGEGIPTEAIPHLFTKFYRVSGKLSQGSKGTGLGLFISKAIIDAHHGKIWVESVVGKGSIFSFSLPFAPDGSKEIPFAGPSMLKPKAKGGSTNQLT